MRPKPKPDKREGGRERGGEGERGASAGRGTTGQHFSSEVRGAKSEVDSTIITGRVAAEEPRYSRLDGLLSS